MTVRAVELPPAWTLPGNALRINGKNLIVIDPLPVTNMAEFLDVSRGSYPNLMNKSEDKIKLYTSRWCGHARSVEGFLKRNNIDFEKISIDGDDEARQALIELNNGFASVPTLLFPDGSQLTEPTLFEIRDKLEMDQPQGLVERVRSILGSKQDE
jgi:mycoredoxin